MIYKRILCVLLAVVLLFTWPGFVPEAHAVAGIDDATIAVGLLFATWAGVTFASSQGAYMAVSNFLSSSAAGLKAASEVATNYVVDGSLKLVQGVKDAFSSFLSEINSTFITADGSNSGAVSGAVPVGVPLSLVSFDSKNDALSSDSNIVFPGTGFEKNAVTVNTPSGAVKVSLLRNGEIIRSQITMPSGYRTTNFLMAFGGVPTIVSFSFYVVSSRYLYARITTKFNGNISTSDVIAYDANGQGGISSASAVSSDADAISFERSSTIDGTQATNAFASATDLPNTVYGDDRDRSLDIGAVAGVVAGGLAGSTAAPGLSPSDLVGALKEALGGTIVTPIPTTPPTEGTEATEATEPGDVPTIVTPSILEGMFGGLRGWLESILAAILAAIQSIPEKIDAFGESLSTWWTEAIADAKAWIDVKIQSIADWWTLFWADTIAAVKALGLTVSEFFTVTFPAWITDVKAWALALPQTIVDAILAALAAAFVPAAGYWDAKIAACMAAFPLFNSIITTGRGFGDFMSGLGVRPPVIYIDLGNSASWLLGGRTIFLDLTWYSQYKPTVDTVISAFLWLLFAWRYLLRIPGLLRGEGGEIGGIDNASYWNGVEERRKNK